MNILAKLWRVAGLPLLMGMALMPHSEAQVQGPETMLAIDFSSGPRLHTLNPQSGAILKTVLMPLAPAFHSGLSWDGERLLIMGVTNYLRDRLIKCHPADGRTVHLHDIGSPWYLVALEADPTNSAVRAIVWDRFTNTDFYISTLDPVTGSLTLGPLITPVGNWIAMAIDNAGGVVLARTTGQQFYSLDVNSGVVTLIGNTNIQNSLCNDLAYDASGQLWGSFKDAWNGANTGIYRIDLATLTTALLIHVQSEYFGLAFGRDTATQNYCAPKTSSIGCSPTLRADGLASPAANMGFYIHADDLNNNRVGMLLYSSSGQAAIPFQGALLCVQPPLSRSPASSTGGNPPPALDCSGSWTIDYNQMIWDKFNPQPADAALLPPLLTPGTSVQCQWWGRDPGFPAPDNTMLSDGLEFVLSP